MTEFTTDPHTDDVLNRLDALLNRDKGIVQEAEDAIPLLTEVYTPEKEQQASAQKLIEELLPAMVSDVEEIMRQAIVELRPKTESILRQHLQKVLAENKGVNQ